MAKTTWTIRTTVDTIPTSDEHTDGRIEMDNQYRAVGMLTPDKK